MHLLVNLLIKLSMSQCAQLEIYWRPLGWRAVPVKNHWHILYSRGGHCIAGVVKPALCMSRIS